MKGFIKPENLSENHEVHHINENLKDEKKFEPKKFASNGKYHSKFKNKRSMSLYEDFINNDKNFENHDKDFYSEIKNKSYGNFDTQNNFAKTNETGLPHRNFIEDTQGNNPQNKHTMSSFTGIKTDTVNETGFHLGNQGKQDANINFKNICKKLNFNGLNFDNCKTEEERNLAQKLYESIKLNTFANNSDDIPSTINVLFNRLPSSIKYLPKEVIQTSLEERAFHDIKNLYNTKDFSVGCKKAQDNPEINCEEFNQLVDKENRMKPDLCQNLADKFIDLENAKYNEKLLINDVKNDSDIFETREDYMMQRNPENIQDMFEKINLNCNEKARQVILPKKLFENLNFS